MSDDPEVVDLGPLRLRLERLVYGTVVLMSLLVVYDGWADLTSFVGVAIVIVAPTLALAVAHVFAEGVEHHAELQRPLRREEWTEVIVAELGVVVVAVPPLVILAAGWIGPWDPRNTIAVLIWTGLATLVALSLLAAHRAGIRGWRLLGSGALGGLVGLLVISLQIVLKPH